jgi:hypothetical protein
MKFAQRQIGDPRRNSSVIVKNKIKLVDHIYMKEDLQED